MILIKEQKMRKDTVYLCYQGRDGEEELYKRVKVRYAEVSDEDNQLFMYLYDSNKRVIREVFRFINYEIREQSYNSKMLAIHALRLLYIYAELFSISYQKITMNESLKLKSFLYGSLPSKGQSILFQTKTKRSSDTVNLYLGVYRQFYEYLGINNSPFHQKRIRSKREEATITRNTRNVEVDKFLLTDRTQQEKRKVPMYIKPHEISKIIKHVRENYSLRDELIIRLMYEYGLRIGEVLGLTLEDIETNNAGDRELGVIIIRNRATDKRYQHAKTCTVVIDKEDYETSGYRTEDVGFQKILPTRILLSKLDEYINEAHGKMSDKVRKNYLSCAKADKVTSGISLEGDNYYIFLNKDGKPLHISGWNKTIRKIFVEVGLSLDSGVREHNLSHRFRHGYAMFLRKYMGASEIDLMNALRHRWLSSVSIYFRPDDDDIYESKYQAVRSMYDICSELKI